MFINVFFFDPSKQIIGLTYFGSPSPNSNRRVISPFGLACLRTLRENLSSWALPFQSAGEKPLPTNGNGQAPSIENIEKILPVSVSVFPPTDRGRMAQGNILSLSSRDAHNAFSISRKERRSSSGRKKRARLGMTRIEQFWQLMLNLSSLTRGR